MTLESGPTGDGGEPKGTQFTLGQVNVTNHSTEANGLVRIEIGSKFSTPSEVNPKDWVIVTAEEYASIELNNDAIAANHGIPCIKRPDGLLISVKADPKKGPPAFKNGI